MHEFSNFKENDHHEHNAVQYLPSTFLFEIITMYSHITGPLKILKFRLFSGTVQPKTECLALEQNDLRYVGKNGMKTPNFLLITIFPLVKFTLLRKVYLTV